MISVKKTGRHFEVAVNGENISKSYGVDALGRCRLHLRVQNLNQLRTERLMDIPIEIGAFLLRRSYKGFLVKLLVERTSTSWRSSATASINLKAWRWSWSLNEFLAAAPLVCDALLPDVGFTLRAKSYVIQQQIIDTSTTLPEVFRLLTDNHQSLVDAVSAELQTQNESSSTEVKQTVFICHASEDKDDFVLPLAYALTERGCVVWLDDFSLRLGDSLRREIERGLAQCSFGIVVLSPNFFQKEWPQRELDSLTAREVDERRKVILPVWHGVDVQFLAKVAPNLADKLGVTTDRGIEYVADAIVKAITHPA